MGSTPGFGLVFEGKHLSTQAPLPVGYHLLTVSMPVLPVSIETFKKQIRVELDEDYEDELLGVYLNHAYDYVTEVSDTSFIITQFRLSMPCFVACMRLPRPPIVSIDSVEYIDSDNNLQTLPETEYRLTADGAIAPVAGATWPDTANESDAVIINYSAGSELSTGVNGFRAGRATQAVLLLAAHWFKHREDTSEKQLANIPNGVKSLINRLRPGDEFD